MNELPAAWTGPGSEPPARSPGVDTNTVWIWLVAVLPLGSSLLSLLIPWGALFDFEGALDDPMTIYRAQTGFFLSPQLWLVGLAGYIVLGFVVYFSYLDHRRLQQLGIQKPCGTRIERYRNLLIG